MLDALDSFFAPDNSSNDYIKIEGSFSFYIQPAVRGRLPNHNCSLEVLVYEDRLKKKKVSVRCKWFRVINERNYEISNNPGTSYKVNAFDIGCYIRVAIKARGDKNWGFATLTFGPFIMNPILKPHVEPMLLTTTDAMNFKVIRHGDKFVQDSNNFENMIKVNQDFISLHFNSSLGLKNFKLSTMGAKDLSLHCDNRDRSCLVICFQNGQQIYEEEENDKSDGSPQKKNKSDLNLDDGSLELEDDNSNGKISPGMNSISNQSEIFKKEGKPVLGGGEEQDSILDQESRDLLSLNLGKKESENIEENVEAIYGSENLFQIYIKFEDKSARDAFIACYRIFQILNSIVVKAVMTNLSETVNCDLHSLYLKEEKEPYEVAVLEMDAYRLAIKRILALNKDKSSENSKIDNCLCDLEQNIEEIAADFQAYCANIQDGPSSNIDQEQLKKVEKSLLDVSMHLNQMNNEDKNQKKSIKDEAKRLKQVEKELENTNKLNTMLMKEVKKMKTEQKSNKKDLNLNQTALIGNKRQDQRNKSQIVGEKNKNNFLEGLQKQESENQNISPNLEIEKKLEETKGLIQSLFEAVSVKEIFKSQTEESKDEEIAKEAIQKVGEAQVSKIMLLKQIQTYLSQIQLVGKNLITQDKLQEIEEDNRLGNNAVDQNNSENLFKKELEALKGTVSELKKKKKNLENEVTQN